LHDQELSLQSQLQNAQLQYNLALEQTKVVPVQYRSAYDAYQQSNARYKSGLATLTELMQALYTLNKAGVDKSVANNNVWRALLQTAAATGDLEIFLNQLP
jgi:outer membrane protein TolC